MLSKVGMPTVWALCQIWGGHTDWSNDPIEDHYLQPCFCLISLSYTWSSGLQLILDSESLGGTAGQILLTPWEHSLG